RGDNHHDELRVLCEQSGVSFEDVLAETCSVPDLYGPILRGDQPPNPYDATSKVASVLRKQTRFLTLLDDKMRLGSDWVKDLGNLYSAALPAWIAAGLEQALEEDVELCGEP